MLAALWAVFVVFAGVWLWLLARQRDALRAAKAEVTRLSAEVVTAGERAAIHERRASEFFKIIAGVERERDQWQKFYFDSARAASVAQEWLARDLGQAVHRANAFAKELRAHGVKVKDVRIDPGITDLVAEFGQMHPDGAGKTVDRAPGFEEAQKIDEALSDLKTGPKTGQ